MEAAIAGLVGVVVGAVISAPFGSRQLTRQLEHADLIDLREFLDEAAIVAAEALRRTNRIYLILTPDELEGLDSQEPVLLEEVDDSDPDAVQDAIAELRSTLERHREAHTGFMDAPPALFLMAQRIMLRLERDDEITRAFMKVYEDVGDVLELLPHDDPLRSLTDDEIVRLAEQQQRASDSVFAVLHAARGRVGFNRRATTGAGGA